MHLTGRTYRKVLGTAIATTALIVAALAWPATAGASSVTASRSATNTTYVVSGAVADPGPVIADVTAAGSLLRFSASGGSHWSGDLVGDTLYHGPGVFDPSTGASDMLLHETFTGTLGVVGTGALDCIDLLHQNADGSGVLEMWVLQGHGALRGIHGYIHFSWTATNPDGSVDGTYQGVLYRRWLSPI